MAECLGICTFGRAIGVMYNDSELFGEAVFNSRFVRYINLYVNKRGKVMETPGIMV